MAQPGRVDGVSETHRLIWILGPFGTAIAGYADARRGGGEGCHAGAVINARAFGIDRPESVGSARGRIRERAAALRLEEARIHFPVRAQDEHFVRFHEIEDWRMIGAASRQKHAPGRRVNSICSGCARLGADGTVVVLGSGEREASTPIRGDEANLGTGPSRAADT